MATYEELAGYRTSPDGDLLRNKVAVAVAIKAQGLIDGGTPTAAEIAWADDAIKNPGNKAKEIFNYVVAKNNTATLTQITTATDATLQTNVNDAVDALIAGGA
jgi:hypothetical protein